MLEKEKDASALGQHLMLKGRLAMLSSLAGMRLTVRDDGWLWEALPPWLPMLGRELLMVERERTHSHLSGT